MGRGDRVKMAKVRRVVQGLEVEEGAELKETVNGVF